MKSKSFKTKLTFFILAVVLLLEKAFCQIPFLPLENPTDYPLRATSDFNKFRGIDPVTKEPIYHKGIDLDSKIPVGSPIYPVMEGKVDSIRYDPTGFGYYIIVYHPDYNVWTLYAHLSRDPREDPGISVGTLVYPRGTASETVIGRLGSTGYSKGPHLHLELIIQFDGYDVKGSTRTDPLPHLLYWEKTKPEIITVSLLPPGESNLLGLWVARDPNAKYGPQGYVSAGQTLNYTVEFENEGEGIA